MKDITRWPKTSVQHIITDVIVTVVPTEHLHTTQNTNEQICMNRLYDKRHYQVAADFCTAHNYRCYSYSTWCQVEETQGGNCSTRTLFVRVKFKISLPRTLPHIYPKLSCLHLTLNCLLVLAHISLLQKGLNLDFSHISEVALIKPTEVSVLYAFMLIITLLFCRHFSQALMSIIYKNSYNTFTKSHLSSTHCPFTLINASPASLSHCTKNTLSHSPAKCSRSLCHNLKFINYPSLNWVQVIPIMGKKRPPPV